MNRLHGSHFCLTFCSLLLLHIVTPCLAFPKIAQKDLARGRAEERQPESVITAEPQNNSAASQDSPEPVVSEYPKIVQAGPSAAPSPKVLPIGTGPQQPSRPRVYTVTEPGVPADVFAPSQPVRTSESKLSKALLTSPTTAAASLNVDKKEGPFRDANIQSVDTGTTETAPGSQEYVDFGSFTTESQEGISLGPSPDSYVTTKQMITVKLQTEESEADTGSRPAFPQAEPTKGVEPGHLMLGMETASQMTSDDTQSPASKLGPATSEYALSFELETDSLLGTPEVTLSVSTATAAASLLSDEWDDTKLESASQIEMPKLGDDAETQVGLETSQIAQVANDGVAGGEPLTEADEVSLGQPEGKTQTGSVIPGEEGSLPFIDQSSFTPTSFMEDMNVSSANWFQNTGDFGDSTKEGDAVFFSETVSISDYTSEAYQPLGNIVHDTVTEEVTAVQEEAASSSVTEEQQVSTREAAEENDKEMEEGQKSVPLMSAVPGATQLSSQGEPLTATVSPTTISPSYQVTLAMEDLMDTVTTPITPFTPVLDSPGTPSGFTEETPSIFPALLDAEASSERRTTYPSVHHVNTAASYGLDQLGSEEGEDEDEEDEEEEDEDEEDEEDDEEEKDADSLGEGLDDDGELPGFTLPGLTSQEPGLERRPVDPAEGATYQVPDSLEWEQQNQGLVRSWMEKLKDKEKKAEKGKRIVKPFVEAQETICGVKK
ncbi:armadillo-like helical domain-containing protein 4 isoform X2 [Suncus etruscus]|uniref:armadillo-like helical domain-containing protein 4 isoform X2 n=1 Tax=Suncus etruscus TaxID=109475 RepID=UPI0021101B73|nr:armadillo-like helical domain-containing protein 4 isoform X2 [Suncus etruscus]